MHIIRIEQRRHIPVLYRADALGLDQAGAGDLGSVAQAHAAEGRRHRAAGFRQRFRAVREELELLVGHRAVLLDVVVVVEVVLVDLFLLTHDVVEVVAVFGHVAAGLSGAVTLGVDQPAAVAVRVDLKLARHQHLVAEVVPLLPVLVREAERAGVAVDAVQIHADRFLQVGLDHAGHGGDLGDLYRVLLQAVVLAQRFYAGDVHARAGAAAEVHRNLIRLLVVQCGQYAFFRCHFNALLVVLVVLSDSHGKIYINYSADPAD